MTLGRVGSDGRAAAGDFEHAAASTTVPLVRGRRSAILLVCILALSAFGPYVVGSVRTEQAAVYASVPLVVTGLAALRGWSHPFVVAWGWMLAVATIGVIAPYGGALLGEPGDVLGGFDNLLLPLIVMLVVWTSVPAASAYAALRAVSHIVVVASALNAVVAMISTVVPLDWLLRPFWASADSVGTVAELAATMGRYSGVFSQPAEAGLVYSIAAILAVWLHSGRPLLMFGLFAVIAVGGALSVSKVFLLAGLPIALCFLWVSRRGIARLTAVVVFALIGIVVASTNLIQQWDGLDYLARLFEVPRGMSLIEFYTAGRWNSDSSLMTAMSSVLDASPLVGLGAAGMQVPYDSQWTETLVVSGLLGLAGVVAALAMSLFRFLRIEDRTLRNMSLAIWLAIIGACFGLPALTANRGATVVWIVIALLVAIASERPSPVAVSTSHRSAPRSRP